MADEVAKIPVLGTAEAGTPDAWVGMTIEQVREHLAKNSYKPEPEPSKPSDLDLG